MFALLLVPCCGDSPNAVPVTLAEARELMREDEPEPERQRALAFVVSQARDKREARDLLVGSLCYGMLVDSWVSVMQEIRELEPVMTETLLRRAAEAENAPWISRFSVKALRESEAFGDDVAAHLDALRLHMRTAPGVVDGTRIGDEIDRYFDVRGR